LQGRPANIRRIRTSPDTWRELRATRQLRIRALGATG